MHRICASLLLLLPLSAANAAEIDVRRLETGEMLISIDGDFDRGDVDIFRSKASSIALGRATVSFRSEGGSLVSGIRIGALIREKKFTTLVPDGAACASACALAWLGGARRFVGQDANVGFHAAYVLKPNGPAESGSGNAVMGAYLNQLGLSESAILYITKTAPTSIQWMTLEDATLHGIAVARLPGAAGADVSAAVAAEQPELSPEQRAREVVRQLVQRSSGPTEEVMPFLASLYAETVVYHGKSTPRQAVLMNKHRLADRWTERDYAIRPGSLSATCAKEGTSCRVKGVVSWKYYDPKTTRRSRGIENFEYRVVLDGGAPQIVAENKSAHAPSSPPGPLQKAQKDLQVLFTKVSKLVKK
jgi:hypothetical protein